MCDHRVACGDDLVYCVVVAHRMRVKKLPHVLALHLKRFKLEQPNRSIKLSYRVVFPLELRLFNTVGKEVSGNILLLNTNKQYGTAWNHEFSFSSQQKM